MQALLRVRDVVKRYRAFVALDGVGFDVARGEKLAVIGPNGAGKTTLFNVLGGQLAPDRGEIVLDATRIDGLPTHRIAQLGVARTFQIAATFASMSVRENVQLALVAHARGALSAARAMRTRAVDATDALLAQVGLAMLAARTCGELAYPDLKRVEIAIAIAGRPRLLLMDEPTAGMASEERRRLTAIVREINQREGMAIAFTEHDMDVVFGLADRVLVLDRGKVVMIGTPAEVRADSRVRTIYLGSSVRDA